MLGSAVMGSPFCAEEMLTYANAFHHESRDPHDADQMRVEAWPRPDRARAKWLLKGRGRVDLRHGREVLHRSSRTAGGPVS